MPLTVIPLPYGLRDVKITPYTDAAATTLAGSSIDLPNSQTLSFTDSEDFETLRGDDVDVATHGKGAQVQWTLEAGGISLEAYAAMAGGTVTTGGTTPAQTKTYSKSGTSARPYFKIEGQVISDSGGDVHCVIYKAKATGDIKGDFADGQFFVTSAEGIGISSTGTTSTGKLYDFVQNETAVAAT